MTTKPNPNPQNEPADDTVVPVLVEIRKRPMYAATALTFDDGTMFTGLTAKVSPAEAERLVALGTCEKV